MTVLNAPVGLDVARTNGFPSAEQLLPSGVAVWGETDSSTLVCRQVQDITHDVKTFLFEPAQPALFQHEPGQFVTLQLQIDGRCVSRCYTISTPPTRPHLLGITVKRQPGGLVSNWLHDTMAPGKRVSADGPFGVFTIARHRVGEVPLPLRGQRDHAGHVDDPDPVRPRLRRRRRVRAQRPDAGRHHLPARARDDGEHGAHACASSPCASGMHPASPGAGCAASSASRCCSCWRRTWQTASCSAAGLRRTWPPSAGSSARPASTCRTTTRSRSPSRTSR